MDKIQLVKQCQSGDREAFGILYQTYFARMRTIVAYYIRDVDIVQDVLHDGFLIVFSSIGSLKNGERIEAWLTSIMKNLSLQYLKDESRHLTFSMTENVIAEADKGAVPLEEVRELSWDELNRIIDKLPEGYGKVFRLAVLDGLPHKEIAALLGIAPHSSSSQLSHAKAMLRHMITQYRMQIGILSIIGIILLIMYGLLRHKEETYSTPIISENKDKEVPAIGDSIVETKSIADNIAPRQRVINKKVLRTEARHDIAEVIISADTIKRIENDSIANDTTMVRPITINREELIAHEDYPGNEPSEKSEWSVSLAYTGSPELNDFNRYKMFNPGNPDTNTPSGEVEISEKTRHYRPLVIGLAINKPLISRWSIETGVRYTFLRSDFLSDSELLHEENIQRIHYIGVPLKFNYRIVTYGGLSLYGQGGGALDIPVHGTQSVLKYLPKPGTMRTDEYRIHAPLQWSIEGGVGVEYHFTPLFSIYAEPSVRYYFNPGSDISTVRQERPFEFTIPIGLRVTW